MIKSEILKDMEQVLKKSKGIIKLLFFLLFFWILGSLFLFLFSDFLIFKNQYSQGPIKSYQKYEEVFLPYDNKEKLYITQSFQKKDDPLVILFFHGNGGRVGRVINDLAPYHNIVAPAYPGYHLSTGISNKEGMLKTVDLSMSYLKEQGIKEENIIIFGASLGGTAALYAAYKYPNVKTIILVGTFDKINSVCYDIYGVFCIFADNIFNNIKLAKDAKAKIRQFHSIDDEIIDFEFGKSLFKDINSEDKKFYSLKGSHNGFDAVEIIRQSLLD